MDPTAIGVISPVASIVAIEVLLEAQVPPDDVVLNVVEFVQPLIQINSFPLRVPALGAMVGVSALIT